MGVAERYAEAIWTRHWLRKIAADGTGWRRNDGKWRIRCVGQYDRVGNFEGGGVVGECGTDCAGKVLAPSLDQMSKERLAIWAPRRMLEPEAPPAVGASLRFRLT